MPYSLQTSPLDRFFTLNASNDAVLRNEVLFKCWKIKILFIIYLFEKFEEITMAPMGNIQKFFKLS